MSELSNIGELKKRKEQLLLEQEIARLERKQSLRRAGYWSWKWVAPLALVGGGFLVHGVFDGEPQSLVFAGLAFIPLAMKIYFQR